MCWRKILEKSFYSFFFCHWYLALHWGIRWNFKKLASRKRDVHTSDIDLTRRQYTCVGAFWLLTSNDSTILHWIPNCVLSRTPTSWPDTVNIFLAPFILSTWPKSSRTSSKGWEVRKFNNTRHCNTEENTKNYVTQNNNNGKMRKQWDLKSN